MVQLISLIIHIKFYTPYAFITPPFLLRRSLRLSPRRDNFRRSAQMRRYVVELKVSTIRKVEEGGLLQAMKVMWRVLASSGPQAPQAQVNASVITTNQVFKPPPYTQPPLMHTPNLGPHQRTYSLWGGLPPSTPEKTPPWTSPPSKKMPPSPTPSKKMPPSPTPSKKKMEKTKMPPEAAEPEKMPPEAAEPEKKMPPEAAEPEKEAVLEPEKMTPEAIPEPLEAAEPEKMPLEATELENMPLEAAKPEKMPPEAAPNRKRRPYRNRRR